MTDQPSPSDAVPAWSRRSRAAQALGAVEPHTRAIVPPIHVSTTYERDPDNAYRSGYVYGRPDNATVREAEAVVAMLEGAEASLLFGSGMAAATAVFQSLDPGAHVVAPSVMYWALRNWLGTEGVRYGYEIELVDTANEAALRAAVRPGRTKLVWLETPANPLWTVTSVERASSVAREAGALTAVDATCASPILLRPLALGADIVMHAATKYLNGHSDVLAGSLSANPSGRAAEAWARIEVIRRSQGAILGPFEAYLLLRGMRTLDLRVRAQCDTAFDLARRFEAHPLIAQVLYPGLPGHPGHAIAAREMEGGFGGMLSVRVRSGEAAAVAAAARVRLWKRATSLGGVESLIEHRASIEGAGSPCPPDLLRLSVGLEDADDLFADLDGALRGANR